MQPPPHAVRQAITIKLGQHWGVRYLFVDDIREIRGAKMHFTDEQLIAMRGGLTAEEYRWKTLRKWLKKKKARPWGPGLGKSGKRQGEILFPLFAV